MLERILNTREKFPSDGHMYVSIRSSGITFNAKASEKAIGSDRRVVILFDREAWQLGFAFFKTAKIPGSFALGNISRARRQRHISGIEFLKDSGVLEHIAKLGQNVFVLHHLKEPLPEFDGTSVYVADLAKEAAR